MICNETCCTNNHNKTICFADQNFTYFQNLTHSADWDIAVRCTICIPLVLMGVIGNSLTIYLLLKNKLLMRTSINLFILNMAFADLIQSLTGPIPFTIKELNQFWILGEIWCYAETYIQVMVQLVSMTSIAIISFDRMLGIVRPFHRHLTKWWSLLIICIIWIYAASLSIPFAVNKNYLERQWKDIFAIGCRTIRGNLHIWWEVVNIGSFWIPLAIMIICYGTIFYNFKKYTRHKQEHPASLHMKRRVLRMLVFLTLLMIFLWVPEQVFEVMVYYYVDGNGLFKDPYAEKVYNIMLTISKYLMFVTPAVNPIVYALMHQNFRRAYRTTFPGCFKGKPKYFLSAGEGSRPFMWTLRTGVSSFACSIRRKSWSMKGRLDTEQQQSQSIQSNSYGNSLNVSGEELNLKRNSCNDANHITPQPKYSQKIKTDNNKPSVNGHTNNESNKGEIHIEKIFTQNTVDDKTNKHSESDKEAIFNQRSLADDPFSVVESNLAVVKSLQAGNFPNNGYVNSLNVLIDEPTGSNPPDAALPE